jgi:CheY-like chemotaxis protein
MSIAATVAPELPMLRRFARLLAGSQASGDAYVVATLEALGADPSAFPSQLPPRQALYKLFLKLWSSALPPAIFASFDYNPVTAVERNLGAITPLPRQAFLLRAVEGFSLAEVAGVLDKTTNEVADLIAQAGREMADQVATEVLIIEDEPIIAFDIEAMVEELGHEVTGIARTHREAIESARNKRPGLVLADILLADGSSGLEAVNEILTSIDVPVIFITAFPERLLTGEKPEPTYFITKPFQPDTVRATISQALFFGSRASDDAAAAADRAQAP